MALELQIPLRTDVAADYHPDMLVKFSKALEPTNTPGPAIMAAGRDALAAVYKFVAACNDAETAFQAASPSALRKQRLDGSSEYLGDLRMTRYGIRKFHGREDEFAAAADAAFKRVTLTTDRMNTELTKYRNFLEKSIATLIDDPARRTSEGTALATEIRNHAKSRGKDAFGFIQKALRDGDKRTIAAVLAAPAFLSGITEDNLKAVRHQAALKFAPTESAQLDACNAILERVGNAQSYGMKHWIKTQEYKNSATARAMEAMSTLKAAAK